MMKRLIPIAITLAVLASTALGFSIVRLDPLITGGTGTMAYSISEDGRYVSGRVTDTDGVYSAAYYDTTAGSGTAGWTVIAGPGDGRKVGAGVAVGIGHRTGGNVYVGLNKTDATSGTRTYAISNQFGWASTNGVAPSVLRTHTNAGSDVMVGYANESTSSGYSGGGAAAFADGSDAWIAASHTQGSTSKGNEAYLYKASTNPGLPWATMLSGRGATKFQVCAVSSTGRVVGWDGAGAGRAPGYWDGAVGGTLTSASIVAVTPSPNHDAAQAWYAYGISNDGHYAVGYERIVGNTRVQAFLANLTTGTAIHLNTVSGGLSATEQAVAFDSTDDGFVIGYDYKSGRVPTYETAIWQPWDPTHTAKSLYSFALALGIDLTGWTDLGVGGASVTKLDDGTYAIAGTGVYEGRTRGFQLIVPEPATLAFLALGGLALLRRR